MSGDDAVLPGRDSRLDPGLPNNAAALGAITTALAEWSELTSMLRSQALSEDEKPVEVLRRILLQREGR